MDLGLSPVLPPFPFPELWQRVSEEQLRTGVKRWLVPATNQSSLGPTYEPRQKTGEGQLTKSDPKHPVTDENYEEDEVVELNEVWAARFSKTIKRMKQKAHKAKRKAAWKSVK